MGEQYVVVYDGRKRGRIRVYTTVYDDHEAQRQMARCRWAHGNGCGARALSAERARARPQEVD